MTYVFYHVYNDILCFSSVQTIFQTIISLYIYFIMSVNSFVTNVVQCTCYRNPTLKKDFTYFTYLLTYLLDTLCGSFLCPAKWAIVDPFTVLYVTPYHTYCWVILKQVHNTVPHNIIWILCLWTYLHSLARGHICTSISLWNLVSPPMHLVQCCRHAPRTMWCLATLRIRVPGPFCSLLQVPDLRLYSG